jgi:hypothetical protein
VLQDVLTPKPSENKENTARFGGVLQDVLTAQPFVLLGLISNITGSMLQDDIDSTLRRLVQLGQDIISQSSIAKGEGHDHEISSLYGKDSKNTRAVQLGGPPVGP